MFVDLQTALAPTHCRHGHRYTPDSYRMKLDGRGKPYRECIECARAWGARKRQKRRERRAQSRI